MSSLKSSRSLYRELIATASVLSLIMCIMAAIEYIRYRQFIAYPKCSAGIIYEVKDKLVYYNYMVENDKYSGRISYYGVKPDNMIGMRFPVVYSAKSSSNSTMLISPDLVMPDSVSSYNCDKLVDRINFWDF